MNELTEQELKEKIERVKTDLELLKSSGTSGRKFDTLLEYQNYLQEELELLQKNVNSR